MQDYKAPVDGYDLVSAEASNEQIAELIGMPFAVFTNTILFAQNSRGRTVTDFMDEDDAGKKEIFATLFNLKGYEQALDVVKPDLKKEREALDAVTQEVALRSLDLEHEEKTLTHLETEKESFEKEKHDTIRTLNEQLVLVEHQLIVENVEHKSAKLQELVAKGLEYEGKVTLAKEQEAELNNKLTVLKVSITEKAGECERKKSFGILVPENPIPPDAGSLEKFQIQIKELELKIHDAKLADQRLTDANFQLYNAEEARRRAMSQQQEVDCERKKLQHIIDSFKECPTCCQPLTAPGAREKVTSDYTTRITKLKNIDLEPFNKLVFDTEAKLKLAKTTQYDLKVLQGELWQVQASINKWEKYHYELAKYKGITDNLEQLEKLRGWEVKQLEDDIIAGCDKCTEMAKELKNLLSKRLVLEQELLAIEKQRDELRLYIETDILPLERNKIRLSDILIIEKEKTFDQDTWLAKLKISTESLKKTLEEFGTKKAVMQQGVVQLESLYEAFGKEGIVAELFREYIPSIQNKAAEYLSELTNNELQIEFSSERQLKRKEADGTSATRAQFQVDVTKHNGGSGYDLVSGSEQNKAALVVNWALSDLAYLHSNVSCNLRGYDEVFDGLDSLSSERLAQCLLRRAEESHQITLVVTHKQELDDVFEHKISLEKRGGVSQLCH